MKILHVIDSADPRSGGPVEAIRNLTHCHEAEGHEATVLTLDPPTAPWLSQGPGRWQGVGDARGAGAYSFSMTLARWISTHAAEYDITILNGLWKFPNLAVWLWGGRRAPRVPRRLGRKPVPYLVFPHGMLDPWFKRQYPAKHLKKALYWGLIERHVLAGASAVCFTCEEERLLARQTFRPYRCREKVVGMGIVGAPENEVEQVRAFQAAFPRLSGRPFLLFLGRIHEKKGVSLLLRAYATLDRGRANLPGLVIAGPPSSSSYLQELQDQARALGLVVGDGRQACAKEGTRVDFLPMLDGNVKWGAFRLAEAFVLPSHQENFGIAVVEALACGTPALVSDKVNIWREIAEDGAGLVDADTEAGTAWMLRDWLQMPSEGRLRMRAEARSCFLQRFHVRAAASSLHRLIEETVGTCCLSNS